MNKYADQHAAAKDVVIEDKQVRTKWNFSKVSSDDCFLYWHDGDSYGLLTGVNKASRTSPLEESSAWANPVFFAF